MERCLFGLILFEIMGIVLSFSPLKWNGLAYFGLQIPTQINMNVLITGASGLIGSSIQRQLGSHHLFEQNRFFYASREKQALRPNDRWFDFEDSESFTSALEGIQVLFLLRPPQLTNVRKIFRPLLERFGALGGRQVVFLSVQGAQDSSWIPHGKIERLIQELGFGYTFLRPSYFMQNLSTTLLPSLKKHKKIILPAGKSPFVWVDVEDIAAMAVEVLCRPHDFNHQSLDITGEDVCNFYEVSELFSSELGINLPYWAMPAFLWWFWALNNGLGPMEALVRAILHALPKCSNTPPTSQNVQKVLKRPPGSLADFLQREAGIFEPIR